MNRESSVEDWPEIERIVDDVGKRLQEKYAEQPIPSGVIKATVDQALVGLVQPGWTYPSDRCYNMINAAPLVFEYHVFERVSHAFFKYLGPNYPYTGSVMWKPSDGPEMP